MLKRTAQRGLALIGVASMTLIVGASALADGPTDRVGPLGHASGSPAQFRLMEERDALVLRLSDQLVHVEGVFAGARPGSPAQFRAHEETEALRERLRSIPRR